MHKCLDIYHTNVHIMFRRARGLVQPQRNRALHLLHSMFQKYDMKMLQDVRAKPIPPADQLSLKLVEKGSDESTIMTLAEALARLEPCSYLVQVKAGTEDTPGTYRILKFIGPGIAALNRKIGPNTKRYYKRSGRSKELPFNTDCPSALLRHRLKLAYGFLLEGSRVEFHLRSKAVARAESVDSALRNHLHLRPDAIMAAMPAGTTMLAIPGTTQLPEEELELKPKRFVNKTSDVFWALEHPPALKKWGVVTPHAIKKLGTWKHHREHIGTVAEQIEKQRLARKPKPYDANRHDKNLVLDDEEEVEEEMEGEMPELSELMPERERGDDGDRSPKRPDRPPVRKLLQRFHKDWRHDH